MDFSSAESLLQEFFEQMRLEFKQDASEKINALAESIEKYREAVSPLASLLPFPFSLSTKFRLKPKEKTINQERSSLIKKLDNADKSITIIIDDIDRLDAPSIALMAKFVKTIADLPNISYLLAYDREATEHALSDISMDGRSYLQKIVQIVIPIRPMMDYEIEDLIKSGLAENGFEEDLGNRKLFDKALPLIVNCITTPRDVKRLIGSFSALQPLVDQNVNSVDVLMYSLISNQFADIREAIISNASKITANAPYNASIFDTLRGDARTIDETFGEIDRNARLLLTFLFPMDGSEFDDGEFGRIRVYSNLMRLLYLGNPPTLVSRLEVVEFWVSKQKQASLAAWKETNPDGFLTTLRENIRSLPAEYDISAFQALAEDRPTRRRTRHDKREVFLEFCKSALISFVSDHRSNDVNRAKRIWEALISSSRLEVPADLLRYHMFAFGIHSEKEGPRGGPTILNEEQTRNLIGSEMNRYEIFVKNTEVMKTHIYSNVYFALLQAGRWSNSLRDLYTSAVENESRSAIDFCATFSRPNYRISRDTIDAFLDADSLGQALKEIRYSITGFERLCIENMARQLRTGI